MYYYALTSYKFVISCLALLLCCYASFKNETETYDGYYILYNYTYHQIDNHSP